MNNDNNKEKELFKVNIEDDGFLNPDELDKLVPPSVKPEKKKFEVHIENYDSFDNYAEEQPQYKGEIYFSNRKPVKPVAQNTEKTSVRKPASSKTKKPQINSFFAVFCSVVLVFTIALSGIAISCINDVLAISRSDETVTINIPTDATTNEIIDILSDNGLVKQKTFCKIFYSAMDWFKNLNKEKKPGPPTYMSGVYYVQKNLGLEGFLTEFKEVQRSADTVSLAFPEGWTIYQMFDRLEKYGVCSKDKLIASLQGTTFENDFVSGIPSDINRTFALEGYFYPDTYEFFEDSDPNSVIRKFLDTSENRWTEEYEEQMKKLGYTRDEIIIIASIIQREAANTEQMGLVSSVIHNRLSHSVSWPTLGCDSTANYITSYVVGNVSEADAVNYEQKYNTYYILGLPPGPICNPGDDAINAALFPDDTDYYFFRHDKYGEIYMAETQAEHDANGVKVLKANSR